MRKTAKRTTKESAKCSNQPQANLLRGYNGGSSPVEYAHSISAKTNSRPKLVLRTTISIWRNNLNFRIYLAALTVCLPLHVQAADWQLIDTTKLGKLKLDKASIAKEDKYTSAILLYEYNEMQKAVPPNEAHDKRQDQLLFDCSAKTFGLAKRVYFVGEKAVQTSLMQSSAVHFNQAPADSLAEKMIGAVCNAVKQTAR
jgi:hypothetical protein